MTIEAALNAEMREHLGFDKHQVSSSANSCNGISKKTLKSPDGTLELEISRDKEGSFSPQLIKKHQTRITSMDEQILSLYAKGMTNREIIRFFKEMYDVDVSASLLIIGCVVSSE